MKHPMQRRACRRGAIVGLCIVLLGCTAARGEEALRWQKPAVLPTFREVLQGDDYTARFEKAAQTIGDINEMLKTHAPVTGARILEVEPDSQASRLGIAVGDVMVSMGDQLLWAHAQTLNRDPNGPQTIHVYAHAKDAMHPLQVQPGRIGVIHESYSRLELLYVRDPQRDPRWDRSVLVAIKTFETDPDLAETAWRHAIQAGYQFNYLSAFFGAAIALQQGRMDEASAFAWHAAQADPEQGQLVHPLWMARLALANCKLVELLDVIRENPGLVSVQEATVQGMIDEFNARPAAQRVLRSPEKLAASMYRDDVMPRLVCLNKMTEYYVPMLKGRKGDHFKIEAGMKSGMTFYPRGIAKDSDMIVRFRGKPSSDSPSEAGRSIIVATGDRHPARAQNRFDSPYSNFMSVNVMTGNEIQLKFKTIDDLLIYYDPKVRYDDNQLHEVRIVRAGGFVEAFLDSKRIAFVPMSDESENLTFLVYVSGLNLKMEPIEAYELIEKP